jgi:hypothetical protein
VKKIISLRQALSDSQYFGGQLDDDSWRNWRILLLAILRELQPGELDAFTELTQRSTASTEQVREFAGVIGRRGAKRAAPLAYWRLTLARASTTGPSWSPASVACCPCWRKPKTKLSMARGISPIMAK